MPSFGLGRCDRRHKLLFEFPIIFWTPRGSLNHSGTGARPSRVKPSTSRSATLLTRAWPMQQHVPGVCRVRSRATRWLRALSGFSVHSSVRSDFLAPTARSRRSVVNRSAPIVFSSCPIDRNPLAARGSFSIARSVRFWLHSRIEVQTIRILP
jgi:hypothetical protein